MPYHQEGDDPNLLEEAGLCNKGGCSLSDLALCNDCRLSKAHHLGRIANTALKLLIEVTETEELRKKSGVRVLIHRPTA